MSIRIEKTEYNKETGISTAILNTDLGTFEGTSKLHEEDRDIESSFAGIDYAERRAVVKYISKKISILRYQLKGMDKCEKAVMNKKEYNHNSIEARTIRKTKALLIKEIEMWKNRKESLRSRLYADMSGRRKFVNDLIKINKTKGDDIQQ